MSVRTSKPRSTEARCLPNHECPVLPTRSNWIPVTALSGLEASHTEQNYQAFHHQSMFGADCPSCALIGHPFEYRHVLDRMHLRHDVRCFTFWQKNATLSLRWLTRERTRVTHELPLALSCRRSWRISRYKRCAKPTRHITIRNDWNRRYHSNSAAGADIRQGKLLSHPYQQLVGTVCLGGWHALFALVVGLWIVR